MKYLKGFLVAVFIGILILMKHYNVLFQTYGVSQSLDMLFGYTAVDVYTALEILGNSGRVILLHYFFIDYIFIFIYGAIQLALIKGVTGEKLKRTNLRFLTVIPYVRGACDIMENAFFIFVVIQMPNKHPVLISFMSYVTQIKIIANIGWILALVIVYIIRMIINIRNRKERIIK